MIPSDDEGLVSLDYGGRASGCGFVGGHGGPYRRLPWPRYASEAPEW